MLSLLLGDTFDHQKSSSFCSLFDAAALSAAVHATPCTAPAFFTPTQHEQSSFQLGWIQPFSALFLLTRTASTSLII
jgi:hypothetical protein